MAERTHRTRQVIDALGYAFVVTAVVFAIGATIRALGGTGWFVIELVMFLLGWVLVGYGTFLLTPKSPWKRSRRENGGVRTTKTDRRTGARTEPNDETAFQRAVQRLPPMRWYPLSHENRLSPGAKVFLSGVIVLLASIVLERLIVV